MSNGRRPTLRVTIRGAAEGRDPQQAFNKKVVRPSRSLIPATISAGKGQWVPRWTSVSRPTI